MIHPDLLELRRVMPILSADQFGKLVRFGIGVQKLSESVHKPLSVANQLTAYLFEWLIHLNILTDAQIRWLVPQVIQDWDGYTSWLEEHYDQAKDTLPFAALIVTIVDGRAAFWSCQKRELAGRWADLREEVIKDRYMPPGRTSIVGNMGLIFRDKQEMLQRLHGGSDEERNRHHAAGAATSTATDVSPSDRPANPDG